MIDEKQAEPIEGQWYWVHAKYDWVSAPLYYEHGEWKESDGDIVSGPMTQWELIPLPGATEEK